MNTVFQDYALFPHMTVIEAYQYGLKIRKVPKPERRRRAERVLDMVRLSGLGGAVSRSSCPGGTMPTCRLGERVRYELVGAPPRRAPRSARPQAAPGDADQANAGQVEQVGTPIDVYEKPATEFVAGFIGISNLIDRERAENDGPPRKGAPAARQMRKWCRRARTWSTAWWPVWSI